MLTIRQLALGILISCSTLPMLRAHAADLPKRASVLTLTGSNAIVGINDNGQPGPTPGDIRTLSISLSNTKDVEVGRAEIVQTLTRQQGDIGTAVKVVVLELPKGSLTLLGDVDFLNFTDPSARPIDTNEQLAVVGGTGIYRGAGGEVDIQVLPSFKSRWVIRIKY